MFKKSYLLETVPQTYQALNSRALATYDLTIQTVWFGLFKTVKTVEYDVPMHGHLKSYTRHWDNLIKTKATFK
jgi:hypothetical protein